MTEPRTGQTVRVPLLARLQTWLGQPTDIASLALYRLLFGLLLAASAARFMASGWVERFYGDRTFFFHYWGFAWLRPLSVVGMYGVYVLLLLLGLAIAAGLFYRVAIVLFFLLFGYVELTDVSNYLNHYYLVSLLALLMCFMPLSGALSLDVYRAPALHRSTLPRWQLQLMRLQLALVYLFAAKAKLGGDWLLCAQPLRSWLLPQVDLPVLGPSLTRPAVALALSWAGMLHDLLVPALLSWRRSRPYAFAALVLFHAATSSWFNIGIFPVLMPLTAMLFFDPTWPRRWLRLSEDVTSESPPLSMSSTVLIVAYCALQLLLPLRSHLYGGNVLWHEQGMRFSWRVLVRAKQGSVLYRVRRPDGGELRISPSRYLTQDQEREMSGQPDLIVQLGQHIAQLAAQRGERVQVRVDAKVSLNGRPPVAMIDPAVDLTTLSDGLAKAHWITPGPDGTACRAPTGR